MKLKIQLQHPNAKAPTYATDGAACMDLYAATVNDYDRTGNIGAMLSHGSPVVCGTGLAFDVPAGHVMLIFSRSNHGFDHNARLANCVGVIDPDYRGEVLVKLSMDDEFCDPETELYIRPGDRIAQAMLVQVPRCDFEVVEQLTITERGAGGFGSTGAA